MLKFNVVAAPMFHSLAELELNENVGILKDHFKWYLYKTILIHIFQIK